MILRIPDYCCEFSCIAESCKDNCCCAGWEIDIDKESERFYKSVKGGLEKRLKNGISYGNSSCIIPNENGRCPFLNKNRLCDIIIELGEEHLCQICTEHPRFYSWFSDVKEGGIGMCCEEAARLILIQNRKFSFHEEQIPQEQSDFYDNELFNFMLLARQKIFDFLYNDNIDLKDRICGILDYGEKLQNMADNSDFNIPEIIVEKSAENGCMKEILKFFLTLETLDIKWKDSLEKSIKMLDDISNAKREFVHSCPEVSNYLRNIMGYFLWRYFLNGVYGEEFLSAVKLSAVSAAVIGCLWVCRWLEKNTLTLDDCIEISKNYSKEIEYSEENINAILDAAYENTAFSTKMLKGLYCSAKSI